MTARLFFLVSFTGLMLSAPGFAETWDVGDVKEQLKTADFTRCQNINGKECTKTNDFALKFNAITKKAHKWLENHGYFVTPAGPGNAGALCKCGCFAPSTQVLSFNENGTAQYTPAAAISQNDSLASLTSRSTVFAPEVEERPVAVTTKGQEKPELFVFHLSNGANLKVTQHHGMVLSDGRVVAAKDVSKSDSFVDQDGNLVEIDGISREKLAKDVVNFEVAADDTLNHIIVAEGVLVGDLSWQNQLNSELGQVHLRQ